MTRRYSSGMTLVEVLIAFVLLGLIFALGFEALYVGGRNLQSTTAASNSNNEWRQSARMLGRFLRQTQAIKIAGEDDIHRMLFSGEREQIMWVAPLTRHGAGIYELRLQQQDDELLLAYTPLRAASSNNAKARAETKLRLITNVRRLRLSYYGSDSIGALPRWHDSWNAQPALPQLVQLVLDHRGQQSELVFPLTISSLSNNSYQVLRHVSL